MFWPFSESRIFLRIKNSGIPLIPNMWETSSLLGIYPCLSEYLLNSALKKSMGTSILLHSYSAALENFPQCGQVKVFTNPAKGKNVVKNTSGICDIPDKLALILCWSAINRVTYQWEVLKSRKSKLLIKYNKNEICRITRSQDFFFQC